MKRILSYSIIAAAFALIFTSGRLTAQTRSATSGNPANSSVVWWKVNPPGSILKISNSRGTGVITSSTDRVRTKLKTDFYNVEVSHPGYQTWTKRIPLGGSLTNQTITLLPEPGARTVVQSSATRSAKPSLSQYKAKPEVDDGFRVPSVVPDDRAAVRENEIAEAKRKAAIQAQARAFEEAKARLKAESEAKEAAIAKAKALDRERAELKAAADTRIREASAARAAAEAQAAEEARLRAIAEANAKAIDETRTRELAEARAKAAEEARLRLAAEEKAAASETARLRQQAEESRLRAVAAETARAEEESRLRALAAEKANAEEVARLKAEENARLRALAEARLRAEEEERARVISARRAAEEERARIKALAEAKARAEAQAQAEAEARAAAEKRVREEAAAHAKAAAEARAKAEAEAIAQAEVDARAIAEAKAKAEEETRAAARAAENAKLRQLVEAKLKAEEEAKARAIAEAEAAARAEVLKKVEEAAKIRVAEEARLQEEEAAKARANAEEKAKALAEAQAKAEAEARARIAEEARLKVLAREEAKARANAEAISKALAEARAKAAADELERAKALAEAKARAEVRAKAAAIAEAEAKAQTEALVKAQAEAKARAEAAALASALEEAEAKAKADERARAEAKAKADEMERALAAARAKADAEEAEFARLKAESEAREAARAKVATEFNGEEAFEELPADPDTSDVEESAVSIPEQSTKPAPVVETPKIDNEQHVTDFATSHLQELTPEMLFINLDDQEVQTSEPVSAKPEITPVAAVKPVPLVPVKPKVVEPVPVKPVIKPVAVVEPAPLAPPKKAIEPVERKTPEAEKTVSVQERFVPASIETPKVELPRIYDVKIVAALPNDTYFREAEKVIVYNGASHVVDNGMLTLDARRVGADSVSAFVAGYTISLPEKKKNSSGELESITFTATPLACTLSFRGLPTGTEVWKKNEKTGKAEYVAKSGDKSPMEPFVENVFELRSPGYQAAEVKFTPAVPGAETVDRKSYLIPLPLSSMPGERKNIYIGDGIFIGFVRVPGGRLSIGESEEGIGDVYVFPQGFWLSDEKIPSDLAVMAEKILSPKGKFREPNELEYAHARNNGYVPLDESQADPDGSRVIYYKTKK